MSFDIIKNTEIFAKSEYTKSMSKLNSNELHNALSKALMLEISDDWSESRKKHLSGRCAYYFSAEFLVGRAIFNNLLCMGQTEEVEKALKEKGLSLRMLEEVEDAALGNGGLGRLAACFLDSAATLDLPLMGYGIRYKYGIFRQTIERFEQLEYADDWTRYGDAWSIRRTDDTQLVEFGDFVVRAVPYDMPVIGYKTKNVGTLRLWQCEPFRDFDFGKFNEQKYELSVRDKNHAENISRVLYPNDSTDEGKKLRLRQQYFFSSASLKDILKNFKKIHGGDFSKLHEYVVIQLNDTHPVISIPELIRLLEKEGVEFEEALKICKKVFNYTNHTVMSEALEKWDLKLIRNVVPDISKIIVKINKTMQADLKGRLPSAVIDEMMIIQNKIVHMAHLAVYCCACVNGVAQIHTEILKNDVLADWYRLYPGKFQNKTNGITQRRWLALCNRQLSEYITGLLGSDDWIKDLTKLKELEKYASDEKVLRDFMRIKREKKLELCEYIKKHDGADIDPDTIFDVQIKRLHEYKRQFLNILCILELYFEIKEGSLKDFYPTTFLFGAKAAPGYARAKGIIRLINQTASMIRKDEEASKYIKVQFLSNYNVSYAEKIVAAADVSEQISTAGTEASGTGNMKLMLNGAVTLGTYDGANIEIAAEAGIKNNYIFGARVDEVERVRDKYDPKEIYKSNPKIKRVLDALVDGTFKDESGIYKELYYSILEGASWHEPDQYFLLLDFDRYLEAKKQVNRDYKDSLEFAKKCWLNMCSAGKFSSDRTIKEYADDIWHITPVE